MVLFVVLFLAGMWNHSGISSGDVNRKLNAAKPQIQPQTIIYGLFVVLFLAGMGNQFGSCSGDVNRKLKKLCVP